MRYELGLFDDQAEAWEALDSLLTIRDLGLTVTSGPPHDPRQVFIGYVSTRAEVLRLSNSYRAKHPEADLCWAFPTGYHILLLVNGAEVVIGKASNSPDAEALLMQARGNCTARYLPRAGQYQLVYEKRGGSGRRNPVAGNARGDVISGKTLWVHPGSHSWTRLTSDTRLRSTHGTDYLGQTRDFLEDTRAQRRNPLKSFGNPSASKEYAVLVGNIGNIYCRTLAEANNTFNEYVRQSKTGRGRAGGEDVVLFKGEHELKTYTGSLGNPTALAEEGGQAITGKEIRVYPRTGHSTLRSKHLSYNRKVFMDTLRDNPLYKDEEIVRMLIGSKHLPESALRAYKNKKLLVEHGASGSILISRHDTGMRWTAILKLFPKPEPLQGRPNPPEGAVAERVLIAREMKAIHFSDGSLTGGLGKAWGLPDGSAFVEYGGALPSGLGFVKAVEYVDEVKAEQYKTVCPEDKNPHRTVWIHDFKPANAKAYPCERGFVLKGIMRLWEIIVYEVDK